MDKVYPVGSIYLSFSDVNPSTSFGGTWEQIEQGRFLISAGSSYTVNSKGGNTSVTSNFTGTTALNINQIPSHTHALGYQKYGKTSGSTDWLVQASYGSSPYKDGSTGSAGSSQGHNHTMNHSHTVSILPPYVAVYMWRRTA